MHIYILALLGIFPLFADGQPRERYSILINEVLPDPTPVRSLPASEFIELRNNSSRPVSLRNWSLSTGKTTGRITTEQWIAPDSLVILASSSSISTYRSFGITCSLTPFPQLDNLRDTLVLISPTGDTIHAIQWNKDTYGNPVKANGGWSLELIDPGKPCLGEGNWTASISPYGGSPGKENSVRRIIWDTIAPFVRKVFMRDPATILMEWSEPITTDRNSVSFVDGVPVKPITLGPFFNILQIQPGTKAIPGQLIKLEIPAMQDCQGNISTPYSTSTGLFSEALPMDLVINEILFDPPDNGVDYLEIFNRSDKIIDLSSILLLQLKPNGSLGQPILCSELIHPVLPNSFVVLCKEKDWLIKTYGTSPELTIECELPTLPDDQGGILITNLAGQAIDRLSYQHTWHHPLLSGKKGVSLERINPALPTQNKNNWHSASSIDGYGTPGRRNSQIVDTPRASRNISLSTKVLSPDMDGRDDLLILHFALNKPGYMASIRVYDITGRERAIIAKNELCGTTGQFLWYGMDQFGQPLPTGNYLIVSVFFSVTGEILKLTDHIAIWR